MTPMNEILMLGSHSRLLLQSLYSQSGIRKIILGKVFAMIFVNLNDFNDLGMFQGH